VVYTDITSKEIRQQPMFISGTQVPYGKAATYLGMNLDAKLRLKEHVKKKRGEFNITFRKCIGCGSKSELSKVTSHYTSKLYVQFEVMVSSSGAAPVILILRRFNVIKTNC
jgi:hypothetical protein